MKQVIEIIDTPSSSESQKTYGFSTSDVVSEKNTPGVVSLDTNPPRKRGPGRPPKNTSTANTYIDGSSIVINNKKSDKDPMESRFEKGYAGTVGLLATAISQTDTIYSSIEQELNNFRNNRSYGGRNRMQHMSDFMNTQTSLINTKIGAIRELNSIRNKINDLVLKQKQMDKNSIEENSDKAVMDAYYALVNSAQYGLPVAHPPLNQASINTGVNMAGNIVTNTSINSSIPTGTLSPGPMVTGGNSGGSPHQIIQTDQSFEEYKNNLTPEQRRMIVDKDPNVKTVVVYNQSTGTKFFDVVNVSTGQSIPGVAKPAEFLLDRVRIDLRNGVAVNSDINATYPLVLIGNRAADEL